MARAAFRHRFGQVPPRPQDAVWAILRPIRVWVERPQQNHRPGERPTKIEQRALAAIAPYEKNPRLNEDADDGVDLSAFLNASKPAEQGFGYAMVGELVRDHPTLREPIIHGLLRDGETMNIIAAPKTGKSWLVNDLAIAIATGAPWLGIYNTVPGKVLIVDNELHRETTADRIPKVAQARDVPFPEIAHRICIANVRGKAPDIDQLAFDLRDLDRGEFKIIILDAFYRFMTIGADENDNGAMRDVYNTIDQIADRSGCAFVLIHHASKGNQSAKSVTDVGAGAGAQARATDTHLVLRPHDEPGVVVLDAAVRSWPPIDPVCLRWSFPIWDVDDALDPDELRNAGTKKKTPTKPEKPRAESWTLERFVRQHIAAEPTPLADLRDRVAHEPGLSWRRAADLLSIAERQSLIERVRLPGRGGRWGYALPVQEEIGRASCRERV